MLSLRIALISSSLIDVVNSSKSDLMDSKRNSISGGRKLVSSLLPFLSFALRSNDAFDGRITNADIFSIV